jgi:hypothetical protein
MLAMRILVVHDDCQLVQIVLYALLELVLDGIKLLILLNVDFLLGLNHLILLLFGRLLPGHLLLKHQFLACFMLCQRFGQGTCLLLGGSLGHLELALLLVFLLSLPRVIVLL